MDHIYHLLKELKSETEMSQDACTFPVVKVTGIGLKGFDVPFHVSTESGQKVLEDEGSFVRLQLKIYSSLFALEHSRSQGSMYCC